MGVRGEKGLSRQTDRLTSLTNFVLGIAVIICSYLFGSLWYSQVETQHMFFFKKHYPEKFSSPKYKAIFIKLYYLAPQSKI